MCVKKVKKFIQCRNCPRAKSDGPSPGYYYDLDSNGFQVVKECECHKTWRKNASIEAEMISSDIVPDYTFDNYRGDDSREDLNCLKMIAEDPERFKYRKMVYIYGPNGCQKTSMIQALGKELIIKGYSVQYTTMNTLITKLVADFTNNEETRESKDYFINKCLTCDFLLVDEAFDYSKITLYSSGYQIPYLDNFLRTRFEVNKLPIIFVSNVLPSMIATPPTQKPGESPRVGFGTSLQSLIERNVRESTLVFKDVWATNNPDPRGLFK